LDDPDSDGELTDFAWIDDRLETITLAIDRIAITMSIDEFFSLRKDIETVVKILETSKDVQLCVYEDETGISRHFLTHRTDGGEEH
jgi:hypothetical protein